MRPKTDRFFTEEAENYEGIALYFLSEITHYVKQSINQYGFFSHDVSEALFLSAKEKEIIAGLFASIAIESNNNIDSFSQDIPVSQ